MIRHAVNTKSLATMLADLQRGADLIDNAGTLADQTLPYPVQCLQVELIGGLGRQNFIVGRCTASAMASASRKSFFWPFE